MNSPQALGPTLLMTHASRAVYRASSELGLGVNLKQFAALTYLREEPRKQQDLGAALVCDPNMLVLILNALEEDGLAVRRRDPEDRRRHIVEATPKGLKALVRAEHQIESLEDTVLAELSEGERETLQRLLAKALEHAPKPVPAS